jgi:quercetin dioxygenase-like cupin family protein
MMNGRVKKAAALGAGTACAVLGLLVAAPLGASPGSGASSTVLARGAMPDDVKVHLKDASDFVFVEVTLEPGGYTGWHYHPGPLLVAVKSGTLTRYDDDCNEFTNNAGASFIEPDGRREVHMGVNNGDEPVVLLVTYLVPSGGPLRVEAAPPPCAASLDL